jgi:hypothetical protein
VHRNKFICNVYCVERHVDMSTHLSTQDNMQNEWTYAAA